MASTLDKATCFATSPEDLATLFPLPLSPFEKFILWDERPRQPMTFFIELHFQTELDIPRLEESIANAIHRNPLLACRVHEHRGGLHWFYEPDFRPSVLTANDKPPIQDGRPYPIDLHRECGIRFWYLSGSVNIGTQQSEKPSPSVPNTDPDCGSATSRLLIQVHHACCDGIGARNVLLEIMAIYAVRSPGTSPSQFRRVLSDRDNTRLADRFDFSKVYDGPPSKSLTAWQRLKNAHYFYFQPPRPIRTAGQIEAYHPANASEEGAGHFASEQEAKLRGGREQSGWHPLQHVIFDRETSARMLAKLREENLTANEVGLGLLFSTCCAWNRLRGDHNPRTRIRLMIPYDLRSRADLRMPASNRLSFSFLGRTHAQCRDQAELVRSVRDEIEAIRQTRLHRDFLEALKFCDSWPRFAKWVINRNRNMSTAVLTYAGEVMRAMSNCFPVRGNGRLMGDTLLTNVLAAPPVRENTNISIGICTNWGQLCISAAWNRDALSAADCAEFLEIYGQSWQNWAGSRVRDSGPLHQKLD